MPISIKIAAAFGSLAEKGRYSYNSTLPFGESVMKWTVPKDVEELEELLSEPYPEDIEFARGMEGDVIILGAGGKMGPTLARRIAGAVKSAGAKSRLFAVSRFTDEKVGQELEAHGITIIRADLLEDEACERRLADLPRCPNVIFMAGMKFGATGNEPLTWAKNAYLPGRVAEHFRESRIVVLSTGNVYPLVAVSSGGSKEMDAPDPVGEYAQSCLGRERVFAYFADRYATPVCIIRLNYAVEARYGVLLDIARRVHPGEPVSVGMGYVNVIWQGDANSAVFRALGLCVSPATVLNVTGLEILSVRRLAGEFANRFGRQAVIEGEEGATALLSDASRCRGLLGVPRVPLDWLLDLTADWVKRGGPIYQKPTKFEVRDGKF
jgi:nucleoside-diphosphate-sugar epimerase